jgi:UDP-N-acetylmuramoylalanine--D-glutamate ligase
MSALDVEGKRIVVVGLGASGVAAARLCLRRGARVIANDSKPFGALSDAARALADLGAEVIAGDHDSARLTEADAIVVSPGVPPLSQVKAAMERGVLVVGEIELATQLLAHPAPVVAIGGTNGKSTTTSLVGAMLVAQGNRTFVGGNLGEPLADHADEVFDVIVLEVSSFQLEHVYRFHPTVCALLNVTDDHLDRYANIDEYAHAKGNAFVQQIEQDWAVLPVGDPLCEGQARRGRARRVTFGAGGDVNVTSDTITESGLGVAFPRREIALTGDHNAKNVAAAIACVRPFRLEASIISQVLRDFAGLPHRTSFVAEVRGVRFYDDSKGTNVGASVAALEGMREPRVVLIAGGRDKGGSYSPLAESLSRKGRAVIVMGEAADAISRAVGHLLPVCKADTMDEAVRLSASIANAGDAVLLSPACSSYDMFRDYKHRGDEFARAARALAGDKS